MTAFAVEPWTIDRFSWSRAGLWSVAALVAMSAHLGGAAWLLDAPAPQPADAPAPAVMIELAPVAASPDDTETEIAPDQQESAGEDSPVEEIEPVEEPVEPPPVQEPVQEPAQEPVEQPAEEIVEPVEAPEEPTPVEAPAEPVEEPVEEAFEQPVEEVVEPVEEPVDPAPVEEVPEEPVEEMPPVEAPAVPLPQQRPAPPPVVVEREAARQEAAKREAARREAKREAAKRKPEPVKKVAKPAPSQSASKARAPAPERAPVAAAPQSTRGASVSPARWQSRLLAHLERRKRYPSSARSRREEGTAYVRFTIDGGGNVLSARLARSSGYVELDQEVVAMVERASPVPAPPPGVARTITVPVRFSLR